MSNFFKKYLFDSLEEYYKVESFFWTVVLSGVIYLGVGLADWKNIWVAFAVTFVGIFAVKTVLKLTMKDLKAPYNLLLEICLYFIAVMLYAVFKD